MRRYRFQTIRKHKDTEVQYLSRTKYPIVEEQDSDVRIIAKYGDNLTKLAFDYYGDVDKYWIIARRNKFTDSIYPIAGQELFIPTEIDELISELNRLNEI